MTHLPTTIINYPSLPLTLIFANSLLNAKMEQSIHHLLDAQVKEMSSQWKGSIPFQCHQLTSLTDASSPLPFPSPPPMLDICDFLGGQKYPTARLYFCIIKYPPPQSNEDMICREIDNKCPGWIDLKWDVMVAAHEAGNPIICNGTQRSSSDNFNNRFFKCGMLYRHTRPSRAMELNNENVYRESSLINNRKNNRKDGIHGPKRIKTVDQSQCTCKFQFLMKWDFLNGFYVELAKKCGNPYHHLHPKVFDPMSIPFPTRLLTSQQREETMHVVNATCSKASGRNFMKGKMGKFINTIKIIYMSNKSSGKHDSAKDDIELMIDDFESSDEISFIALSDVPMKDMFPDLCQDANDDTITISSYKSSPGLIISKKLNDDGHMADLASKVAEERVERNLSINKNLFIAVAWVVKSAF